MDKTVRIILSATDNSTGVLGALGGKLKDLGLISDDFAKRLKGLSDSSVTTGTKLQTLGQIGSIAMAAGMAYGFDKAVKSAADFQAGLVPLVASAGEVQANLGMVSKGIMEVASATGYSAQVMVGPDGPMYQIESAGFHGAAGLNILKAAAQGARAENANLTKVADAVTSALVDYHLPASAAADVTSKLVVAVGQGKANFEQFTGALHSVLPIASAAHVSMSDVLGDLASMTVHGMSADQATQNLAHAIGKMQSPTAAMTGELSQLGINSSDLAASLGKKGLSGTLEDISIAIMDKMGPAGKVMLNAFNGNKVQAADMMQMISAMPSKLQTLATAWTNGGMSALDYKKAVKELPTDQANLMTQFQSLAGKATGFSDALKAGKNTSQTYAQALQAATGDQTTLNVALMTAGENANYTKKAVDAVSKAHADAKGNTEGFAIWQQTLSAKMDIAKSSMSNMGIVIGTVFLPPLTNLMNVFMAILTPIADFVSNNATLSTVILGVVGALATLVATISIVGGAATKLQEAWMLLTTAGIRSAISTAAAWVSSAVATAAAWVVANAAMIGIWGLVIAAVIGAVVLIVTHWSQISKFFADLWSNIAKWAGDTWKGIVNTVSGFVGTITNIVGGIGKGISNVFNGITNFFKQWGLTILAVAFWWIAIPVGLIIMHWKPITAFFNGIANGIKAVFTPIIGFFVGLWQREINGIVAIFNLLVTFFKGIWNGIVAIFTPVVQWFGNIFHLAWIGATYDWNIAVSWFQGIWNGIANVFAGIGAWFGGVFRQASNGVTSAFSGVVGFFGGIWNAIVGIFTSIGGAVGNAISGAVRWAVNGVLSFAVGAINTFIGAIDTAIDIMNAIPGVHIGKIHPMGVPKFASGTNYFQGGGLALVGEHGPELAVMPQGTKIMPSGQTSSLLNGATKGGETHYHMNVNVGAYAGQPGEIDKLGEAIWQSFQRIARRHGQADQLPNIGIRPV